MNKLAVLAAMALVFSPLAAQAEIRSVTVGKSKISATVAPQTRDAGLSEEELAEAIRKTRPALPILPLSKDDGERK